MRRGSSKAGWYSRRVTVTAVFLIVMALSTVSLREVSFGSSASTGERRFSVVVELFGSDAEKIERTITVPIEEALAAVPCITSLRSVSRYGYSRTDLTVSSRCDPNGFYLELRDAVDRTSRGFPRSVQKPKIFTTGSSSRPVFIAAFSTGRAHQSLSRLRDAIETGVKPEFEKIEGTGEIEIGGGALSQIHVAVSSAKSTRYGLTLQDIAAVLQAENSEGPLGTINEMGRELSISLGGGYETVEDITATHLSLRGGFAPVRLSDIAAVTKGVRTRDSISRVDGQRRVVLAVKDDGSANIISLSGKLNGEIEKLRRKGFECTVVLDEGRTAGEAVVRMIRAIFFSICSVCLFLVLFAGRAREILVLVSSLPVVLLTSAALLATAGISLGPWILSGFTVGIGLIIDSGIIISEHRPGNSPSPAGALISSAATTIAAAVPLFLVRHELPQIGAITLSLTVLIAAGTVLPLLFMPAYLSRRARHARRTRPSMTPRVGKTTSRGLLRCFYRTVMFAIEHRKWMIAAAAVISGTALAVTAARGIDFSAASGGETVYAHIEGKTAESVSSMDKKTSRVAAMVRDLPGIERTGTTAKRGSAEMTITFDPARTARKTVEEAVERAGAAVPGCFVYIPESGGSGPGRVRAFEVTISGSDISTLKRIARRSADLLSRDEAVEQVVFHFKEDLPAYLVRVNRNRAGLSGWSAAEIGDYLNRTLYGPPAVKWRLDGREIDVRVMGENGAVTAGQDLAAVPLPAGGGRTLRVGEITTIEPGTVPSAIYRKNRQRAVYITVHTRGGRLRDDLGATVEAIRQTLSTIRLPAGYGFEMDKRIFELRKRFRLLGLLFALSAVLIYMILAAQFESFLLPVPIMLSIPASLSLPLLVRSAGGTPLTVEALIGIIILGGIIANNAILITTTAVSPAAGRVPDDRGIPTIHRVVGALRTRLRPLLLTSGTTVLSSVPLLVSSAASGQTGGMAGTLASIMIWGIVGSLLSTFLFLPAVLVMFPGRG